MNLIQLRTETLAHGFDPVAFTSRINDYLNNALAEIARRANYYVDEAAQVIVTVPGTAKYSWPADFARARSMFNIDRQVELQYVGLRDIDRSSLLQGNPTYYAVDGASMHVYPIPDGVYNLEMRYWKLPPPLVNDTDIPTIPQDYHNMLWEYAVMECYAAEDDPQTAQYWAGRWKESLSMFTADQKFPAADGPNQARGMWDAERTLGQRGWSLGY